MIRRIVKDGFTQKRFGFRYLSGLADDVAGKNNLLSGVRILDFSRIMAGPFCTMLLGDLGAEIIKVENPNGGDETRGFGPHFVQNESLYFLSINRNKKSICIDLKTSKGRELVKELAKKSDILMENFVPGKMESFGLDYENLKAVAPHLIYCSISGFGSTGPYKTRPAVDIIAASIGGFMHITGPEDGEPCSAGVTITDISTGLYAHGAILAALLQRTKTGKGQQVECDLLSSQVSVLSYVGLNYLNAGAEAKRMGSRNDILIPYQAFKTKDGHISVSSVSSKGFKSLCKILELPDFSVDPRFALTQDRLKNRDILDNILENKFITKTTEEWLKILEGSHIIYGAVNNMEGVFKDPQVVHKKMVCDVKHSSVGDVKLIGPAVSFSDTLNTVRSPPPYLGEHTDVILSQVLSCSPEQIQDLRNSKVVQ